MIPRRCRRANSFPVQASDLTYLLNKREKTAIKTLKKHYLKTTGRDPNKDPNLFIFCGDNPSNRKTWSGSSGRIPTFRKAGGLMWSPFHRRFMCAREKMASLGFPVTPATASAMGTPMMAVRDAKRMSTMAGNAMHFSSIGIVQFVALACYKALD